MDSLHTFAGCQRPDRRVDGGHHRRRAAVTDSAMAASSTGSDVKVADTRERAHGTIEKQHGRTGEAVRQEDAECSRAERDDEWTSFERGECVE